MEFIKYLEVKTTKIISYRPLDFTKKYLDDFLTWKACNRKKQYINLREICIQVKTNLESKCHIYSKNIQK